MEKIILLITMAIVLVGTVCIYGSRNIVKYKIKNPKNENKIVLCVKIIGCILVVLGLIGIYIIIK